MTTPESAPSSAEPEHTNPALQTIAIEDAAARTGASVHVLQRLVAFELVKPVSTQPEIRFRTVSLERMRLALRLHYELEVSWSSMGLVLDLLERIDTLEHELRRLRGRP